MLSLLIRQCNAEYFDIKMIPLRKTMRFSKNFTILLFLDHSETTAPAPFVTNC